MVKDALGVAGETLTKAPKFIGQPRTYLGIFAHMDVTSIPRDLVDKVKLGHGME